MPRAWPSNAPSPASPARCAADPPSRTVAQAAAALIDRLPIGWRALASRSHSAGDRAAIDNLRTLERLRDASVHPRSRAGAAPLACRIATTIAVVQTFVALATVSAASLAGHVDVRPLRVAFTLAFAAAAAALSTSGERRAFLLLAVHAAAASAFARALVPALPGPLAAAVAPAFAGVYPEALLPAWLWLFALEFPRVHRFTRFDRLARAAAVAASVIGAVLLAANVAAAWNEDLATTAAPLLRNDPRNLFWSVFAALSLPALAVILARARRAPRAERRRTLRLAASLAFGAGPLLAVGAARAALPAFDGWMLSAPVSQRAWVDGPVLIGLLAAPLLSSAALLVDRPFQYSVTLPVQAWLTLRDVIGRRPSHRRTIDHLAQALERLRSAHGTHAVSAVVAREVRALTGAASAMVLALVDGSWCDGVTDEPVMNGGSAVPSMLAAAPYLDLSRGGPLRMLLPPEDRACLEEQDVEHAAAIRLPDDRVLALVLLGAKRGGRAFTAQDRAMLTSITAAAASPWLASVTSRKGEDRGDEPAFECARCGCVAATAAALCSCGSPTLAVLPPRVAGKFTVLRRLGSGATGIVYLAHDTALDRLVALKTLTTIGARAEAQLQREARAMAALDHPHIARVHGLERCRRAPVLVVEFFPEGTLEDRLRRGTMETRAALTLGAGLADALACLHGAGLAHGDLKPSNIGVTAAGSGRLLDFGLTVATRAYLPPEAVNGALTAPDHDLWALATVLLECVAGAGTSHRRAASLRRLRSGDALDRSAASLLGRALSRAPADRFRSARQLADALSSLTRRAEP